MTKTLSMFAAALLAAGTARAQSLPDVFLKGVPSGSATQDTLTLTLSDAIARGLKNNLGALTEEQRVRGAEGTRWRALSDLLPHANFTVRDSEQKINLAAFGFTGLGFPGIPNVIGPFNVFDARVAVSAPLFDRAASETLRADTASLNAERATYRSARELVIVVVARLYLDAIADASRVTAARTQLATAQTLAQLAEDQRQAGLVAGIDVLRQNVLLESAKQRLITAENTLAKQKLALARAIGMPAGQKYDIADKGPDVPPVTLTLDAAVTEAMAGREDVKIADSRVEAARANRASAQAGRLPSVHLDADYGAIGATVSSAEPTFTVGALVRVPIFQGGATRGRIEQTDAELKQREAEAADVKAGVQYEVAAALLDITAADAGVTTAKSAEALAQRQLEQAQDRFRAGVSSSIELAQAQEALATAADNAIAATHARTLAALALGRSLGLVEERLPQILGGRD